MGKIKHGDNTSQANMANCERGPQEKPSSSSKEFGELNKEDINRLRNILGIVDKQLSICFLAQTSKSFVSYTLRALDLSFTDSSIINSRAIDHMINKLLPQ